MMLKVSCQSKDIFAVGSQKHYDEINSIYMHHLLFVIRCLLVSIFS